MSKGREKGYKNKTKNASKMLKIEENNHYLRRKIGLFEVEIPVSL